MKDIFNPYFGSVFRSKKNPTFFSRRLFRVADVYTSRVTNFHNYSLGVSEYFLHGKRNQNYLKIYLHFFSTHSILEEEFYHMNSKLGLSSLLYIKYMDGLKKKKKVEKNKFDAFKHVIKNFKPPSIISLKIESLMKKTKIL